MDILRLSRMNSLKAFLSLVLLSCTWILLSSTCAGAAPLPGDCTACHGDKKVLPDSHPDTKGMAMAQCQMCHGPGKIALSEKFLAIHKQLLPGDAQGSKEPEARPAPTPEAKPAPLPAKGEEAKPPAGNGKAAPAKAAGPAPACTACHSGPEFTKFFSPTKHGALRCSACHKGVAELPRHMKGAEPVQTASCLACHKGIAAQGFHATVVKKYSCAQCHSGIHPKEAPKAALSKVKPATPAPAGPAPSLANCAACHSGPEFEEHFAKTGHGKLSCATCHSGITDLGQHMKKQQKPGLISCGVCHKDIEGKHKKSAHALKAKLSCLQCHTDIHPAGAPKAAGGKTGGIASCLKCHSDKDRYLNRGHGARVLAGNNDAAACSDCHTTHGTPVFAGTDEGKMDKREYYTALCISCHRPGGVAGRYGVFPMAVEGYGETYHGKAGRLGYLDKVAGCADCHLSHNILPPEDPASALNASTLVKTCGECHEGFHPRFVSYVPHPDPDNPEGFLSLYLTKKFMILLLAGVFLFFWAHSILWWRKAYSEKSCLIKGGGVAEHHLPLDEGRQYVRRFSLRDRVMHVVLILSFFGVVISGFPIKYPGAPWAPSIMSLFGGPEGAALVHRVSATAMCLLFLYTCWLSLKFLFPGFQIRGWVGRLFGPDSLFPRMKDLTDCWGMFRWFFNAGEKPLFDRWTYWEKFDFMAVFWGMFVIGLSGVIMWLPELSSHFMPGWMINITHLAHSEEAFLAAVFIFTVHFFNNHIVPDKFPLERNVFTGRYTLEALKHERPLEYERIIGENRLEEIKTEGPGTGSLLFAGLFGIASVLLGLALTVLIFWAVFAG